MKYAEKQLALGLGLASAMLEQGRPIKFVKFITRVSIARMAQYGLIREHMIPDMRPGREGQILRTGMYVPTNYVPPAQKAGKSRLRRSQGR